MSELTANEIDALLEALRAAPDGTADDGARTAEEMAQEARRGVEWVRKRIKKLLADRRVEHCKVRRQRIDGQMQWVSAYRLIA